jgi:MFS family permease
MQTTAQAYLVYQLTGSPAYLGFVGFAAGVPPWLFMLYGGVVADRIHRRRLMVITQNSMMTLAFILAGLAFSGLVRPWHIILLAFGLGTANSFDARARQAFVLEMVDRKHLTNAIALNSTMFNMATVIGPAVGGLTYAALGPAWCFTLNGLSFIAVIVALLLMKLKAVEARPRQASLLEDLKAGPRYIRSQPVVLAIIAMTTVTSLFGLAFVTLLPAWAVSILGGDSTTFGLLQSSRGIGALLGALMVATMVARRVRGKLMLVGSLTFPALLVTFALIPWLPVSLVLLVGVGWGMMMLFNTANALVQDLVPDHLRGRIMSFYSLTFFGFMPLGALLAGILAQALGSPITIIASALVSLLFNGLIIAIIPRLRRLA